MNLVQLLIPIYDNEGHPFPRALLETVRQELTDSFGGVTAFVRSPAEGFWKESEGDGDTDVVRDDVVMYEVMVEDLDRAWWSQYRKKLEHRFRQDEVVIRTSAIERL